MDRLKFTRDSGSEFYRDLSTEVDVFFRDAGITKTGNALMRFKMALYFSLDILFYVLMMKSHDLLWFYLFYLLMGLSVLLTAFNISHDASHGVAVRSKFWNKILFSISFNLQGNNAYIWGKNHNESHHLYTNVEGSDIDVLNNPLLRMTSGQPLKWFHQYQAFYIPLLSLLYSINWFFIREILMVFRISSRTIKVDMPLIEILKLFIFKVLYIAYMIVLPIYFLTFEWYYILGAFILNHFMVSIIFTGVLGVSHLSDYVEHPLPDQNGNLPCSWPMLQMSTSIDYNAESVLLNWILGGFNAHALHHLLPNISHVHYLKILPIFKRVAAKHGMVYMNMPYSEALRSYFRFLEKMGNQLTIETKAFESETFRN